MARETRETTRKVLVLKFFASFRVFRGHILFREVGDDFVGEFLHERLEIGVAAGRVVGHRIEGRDRRRAAVRAAHLNPRIHFAEAGGLEVVAVVGQAEALLDVEQFGQFVARDRRAARDRLREIDRASIGIGDLHFEVSVLD